MKYFLVLELRPNDFMPVDINLLIENNDMIDFNELYNIDLFTSGYSTSELYDLIIKNNVVPNAYFEGELKIINDNKYRFPIITKDVEFDLSNFIVEHIEDKQIMNKIKNVYSKYDADENGNYMQHYINTKNYMGMINMINALGYEKSRNICMYIIENILEPEQNKKREFIEAA